MPITRRTPQQVIARITQQFTRQRDALQEAQDALNLEYGILTNRLQDVEASQAQAANLERGLNRLLNGGE